MRVNVYAEEMTPHVEIISKVIDGQTFTGCRFYLHLPVSFRRAGAETRSMDRVDPQSADGHLQGPFIHRPGDDDSSAVTFWGKQDLRTVLKLALAALDAHYGGR